MADDELDLSKAELFADSARGVYIPQYFAQTVKRECVTGVGEDDYKVLEAGPDHEHYWDAWADVTDNASITNPKTGERCYLHQDGDLWIVPVEKEEEATDFEWTCPACETTQTETIDPVDGPFLTCTCEKCGVGFDQDAVRK